MFLVNKAAPCMWEHGFILDLGIYASFMFPWTYHNCFDHILCILLTHIKANMTTIELCYIIFMHHMANLIWVQFVGKYDLPRHYKEELEM